MTPSVALDCRKIDDFGIGTYVRGLLSGFAALGRPERLVLVGGGAAAATIAAGIRGWRYVPETAAPYSVSEQVALARRAREADVWHFPHYVTPVLSSTPFVVTIHDLIHIERPRERSALHRAYALFFLTRAASRARIVVTATHASAATIAELSPGSSSRIRVIPHAVSPPLLEAPAPSDGRAVRERLGVAGRILLYVGNDLPHKNLPALLQALASIRDHLGNETRLVLAGTPSAGDRPWRKSARELGVSPIVVAPGRVSIEELRALYAEAALVFPSLAEGRAAPRGDGPGTAVLAARIPPVAEALGPWPHATSIPAIRRRFRGPCARSSRARRTAPPRSHGARMPAPTRGGARPR
ncbi:MAG: glycosyltransferase family 1 protein [Acidobacteriota bacterium]